MPRILKQATVLILIVVLLLATVACNQTAYTSSANIIEASDLTALMQNPDTVVIDARSAEDYAKGHLTGSICLTPDLLSVNEPVPNLIAPADQVAAVLGEHGIGNQTTVLIYDNNQGVSAGRIWWVLKTYGHAQVKVVNNGEKAILKAGLPMTQDVSPVTAVTYNVGTLNDAIYATQAEVIAAIEGTTPAVILDVRSAEEFAEGAIPAARLYPHTKNLYTDGSFKSSQNIWLDYHDLGLNRDDAIILYCKTSFRASQTMLLLTDTGFTNVQVYDGAWVEWSAEAAPAVEATETPAETKVTVPAETAATEPIETQPGQTTATTTQAQTEKPAETTAKPVVKPTEPAVTTAPPVQSAS
ncbi:MAG: rhodanese-like domain-containing protein [Eubacteriales bacterium]|nr:rhodanese-like domain-containing protein [Eubacteriales bacterium]